MERGSISKPRRGASGETKPAYTLTLNLHPPQLWGINFCVSHPFCGILSRQPMQMNAVSRLKQDAWFLEPRGEAFSTQFFRNFSEGPRASLGSNIRELPGKKLRREERLPPALLLSFIFSDSDILKMKGNRSHVLCGYWGVWTITVRPRLIMTLGTLRHLNLSLLSLGFPSHKDWAWIRSLALYQVGTSDAQMSQPCPASCWHSTGGAEQAPLPLGGHLVSRGYIFGTWGWNFYGPTFSNRTF